MKLVKGIKARRICNEYIIVSESLRKSENNCVISLNPSAALLWEFISGVPDFSIDSMASILENYYGIDHTKAVEDVSHIVEQWLSMGLIET